MAYVEIICPDIPSPDGIHMLKVEPRAIFDIDGMAWVGLTPRDYEHLGINTQEFIRFIKAQKGQTKYYRDCILNFNEEIEKLRDIEENSNA